MLSLTSTHKKEKMKKKGLFNWMLCLVRFVREKKKSHVVKKEILLFEYKSRQEKERVFCVKAVFQKKKRKL